MRLTLAFAVISMISSFAANLFMSDSRKDWIEKSTLGNRSLTNVTAWLHSLLAIMFTALAFLTVFEMRNEARELYKET